MATTERRYDKGVNGWRDGDTLFFAVSCWRNLGENVLDSLHKGDPVVVQGRLRDGSWEKDGITHSKVEIEASAVGHDLARGVSRFTKSTLQPRERFVEAGPELPARSASARCVDRRRRHRHGDGVDGIDGIGGIDGIDGERGDVALRRLTLLARTPAAGPPDSRPGRRRSLPRFRSAARARPCAGAVPCRAGAARRSGSRSM